MDLGSFTTPANTYPVAGHQVSKHVFALAGL